MIHNLAGGFKLRYCRQNIIKSCKEGKPISVWRLPLPPLKVPKTISDLINNARSLDQITRKKSDELCITTRMHSSRMHTTRTLTEGEG